MIATLFRFVLRLSGALPLGLRQRCGYLLGMLFSLIPTQDRKIAKLQLKAFLGPSYSKQGFLARIYGNLGQTIFECLNLQPLLDGGAACVIAPNWDKVEVMLSSGRPIVALSAHTANWDLLAAYLATHGVPLVTIGREAKNPLLHETLSNMREKYGVHTLWRSSQSLLRDLLECLKNNKVIAALIDQDTYVRGERVPFFGKPVSCPSTLIELGKRKNAIIVSGFISRTPKNTYEITVKEIDGDQSVSEILREYNSRLESHVRRFPDQWVWIHKRWRTLDDGVRLSSRAYIKYLQEFSTFSKQIRV